MRKQLAVVALLMLLCGGMGSSALLARAFAQSKALTAAQQEKLIGPKPIPAWYWRWVQWRMGEGYAKGHALQAGLRPSRAPHRVPQWAWERLHYFMLAREQRLALRRRPRNQWTTSGSTTSSTTTTTATTPTTTTTTTTTTTQGGSVAPPAPPGSYSVPAGAVSVSSSAQLASALAAGAKTIVLADGTYGGSSYFNDAQGSSLYAQNPLGAVLTAGLVVGGTSGANGAVIRGLAFDVTNQAATFQSAELNIWGTNGDSTQVLDSTFDGNWAIDFGILAMNPNGLVAQRLQISHFTSDGLRASDDKSLAYGSSTKVINSISDISVDGVSRATPGASNGTAEAGIWIGEPVTNGVHRIKVRNVSISGIETVADSWDTTFSDLDIDMSGPHQSSGVGVYLEHFSLNDTFTNFVITGTQFGFNAEWDDGTVGNEAARNDTIENGSIDASGWTKGGNSCGVFLDQGTGSTTITGVTFKNQSWAGIGEYLNSGTNTISGNTYQLSPGAVSISTGHP